MDLLKKYQVVEHNDGDWSVASINLQTLMGVNLIGEVSIKEHGFSTAAEAQERADELNEAEKKQ